MKRTEFLRSGFNYDVDEASVESGLSLDVADCVVQQQFAEETDINTIVRRFGVTGELPVSVRHPMVGDFTAVTDFQSALNALRQAEAGFADLPARVRARFDNDPGQLLLFLDDEANRKEAVELGIVMPEPEKTRDAVQAIDELAARLVPKPA